MPNPTRLTWQHQHRNTDGSPFTAEQFAGWLIEVNGEGAVSVPAGYDADGQYDLPLANISAFNATGEYTVRMAVTNRAGIQSDWSSPLTFSLDFRKPLAPFGVSVSA